MVALPCIRKFPDAAGSTIPAFSLLPYHDLCTDTSRSLSDLTFTFLPVLLFSKTEVAVPMIFFIFLMSDLELLSRKTSEPS